MKKKLVFTLLLAGSALGIGTHIYFGELTSASESQPGRDVEIRADLADIYSSLDELVADSILIVEGKFVGNPNFREARQSPAVPPRKDPEAKVPSQRDTSLISLRSPRHVELMFQVKDILKGSAGDGSKNQKITIAQIAMQGEQNLVGVTGDRLFQPGQQYVLFLKPSSLGNYYWVSGASQGAFLVDGEFISSLNNVADFVQAGPRVRKKNVREFSDEVRHIVNSQ